MVTQWITKVGFKGFVCIIEAKEVLGDGYYLLANALTILDI